MSKDVFKIVSDKKKKLQEEGLKSDFFSLLQVIIVGIFEKLRASWSFRKAKSVGSMVLAKKSPLIEIHGDLIIGDRVKFWSKFEKCKIFVKHNAVLKIDDDCFINGVHISASVKIHIGKNVHIGPYTIIMDNDFHSTSVNSREKTKEEIIIGDNVWIAMRCMIMKGVTIGQGAVVAAGAIVTKDVPPFTVVGGIPAKILKHIEKQY
ncbi:acyltransferase [Mongoliitalea lutea]|uniref:Transferase n=1 Tax=Mongoliitalea lutea TaxID=849756 RepID=A0A8J3CZW2_9BACT|nr:acyltransferase [Mongoliitalea lutea]GHB49758.1 transferase [Mongoliitalea lutea]